jgi:hypothetical protein
MRRKSNDRVHSLKNSKQNSRRHETSKVSNQSCASHDNAPAKDEKTEIYRRAFEFLEKDVARNLEQNVWNED